MEIYEIEEGKMVNIIFMDFFVCFAFPIRTLNESLLITLLSHCYKFENTLLFFQSMWPLV